MHNINKLKIVLPIFILVFLLLLQQNQQKNVLKVLVEQFFKFNMALDDIILEPLAKGYNKLPSPIRAGTSNFTSNLSTLMSIPNNLLQGNLKQLGHSVGSFAVNTTVGVLGFLIQQKN